MISETELEAKVDIAINVYKKLCIISDGITDIGTKEYVLNYVSEKNTPDTHLGIITVGKYTNDLMVKENLIRNIRGHVIARLPAETTAKIDDIIFYVQAGCDITPMTFREGTWGDFLNLVHTELKKQHLSLMNAPRKLEAYRQLGVVMNIGPGQDPEETRFTLRKGRSYEIHVVKSRDIAEIIKVIEAAVSVHVIKLIDLMLSDVLTNVSSSILDDNEERPCHMLFRGMVNGQGLTEIFYMGDDYYAGLLKLVESMTSRSLASARPPSPTISSASSTTEITIPSDEIRVPNLFFYGSIDDFEGISEITNFNPTTMIPVKTDGLWCLKRAPGTAAIMAEPVLSLAKDVEHPWIIAACEFQKIYDPNKMYAFVAKSEMPCYAPAATLSPAVALYQHMLRCGTPDATLP